MTCILIPHAVRIRRGVTGAVQRDRSDVRMAAGAAGEESFEEITIAELEVRSLMGRGSVVSVIFLVQRSGLGLRVCGEGGRIRLFSVSLLQKC